MFKVKAIMKSSTGPKMVIDRAMDHLPRCGDIIRVAPDCPVVKVIKVVWCLDEPATDYQRVNLMLEAIEL